MNYIGNPDYRGYLAYKAQQGDANAKTLLNYVGNDGNFESGTQFLAPLSGDLNNANTAYYNEFNQALQGGGGSVSSGSNTQAAQDASEMADEQAYWDDQIRNADSQLGRLGTQRDIADQNITKQWQSGFDRLTGDKTIANRDYTRRRGDTIQDNIETKSSIDTGVRNRLKSFQNLIRGNSSAREILAPYAAATQGNSQRGQVQKVFGRNISALDTGWEDTERQFTDSFKDLDVQRDTRRNETQAGFAQTEAQLLEAKQNAAVAREQAGGASYRTARSARTPYESRIQQLLGTIDSLGAAPTFTPKAVNVARPDLSQYTYEKFATPTQGSGVNPSLAGQAGAYWTLLRPKEEERAAA